MLSTDKLKLNMKFSLLKRLDDKRKALPTKTQ